MPNDVTLPLWVVLASPAATFAAATAGAYVGGWLTLKAERERSAREAAARQEADERVVAERRSAFQRETRLSLQDSLHRMGRFAMQVHLADVRHFREEGIPYGTGGVPTEADEHLRIETSEVTKLAVRVVDDELRALVNEMKTALIEVTTARSSEAQVDAVRRAGPALEATYDRVGKLLRETY
jgi:hypothetical protein